MHLLIASVVATALAASSQAPRLGFGSGCISVAADGVGLRDLLTDWGRIGNVTFTGLEELADRSITLHIDCLNERKALDDLLDSVDRLMVPRDVHVDGASAFSHIVILSRNPGAARHAPVQNTIPEIAYPDPVPGRDWSALEVDLDGPPPIVIRLVAPATATSPAEVVPEATFEYTRPMSGVSELLPEGVERDHESLAKLLHAIRDGAIPESLFEYSRPSGAGPAPDRKQDP